LRLFLTAIPLHLFTGWDLTTSILVMGGLTLLYTYLGGMEAVIWTDLIQFVIYVLGAVIAGAILVGHLPASVTTYLEVGTQADKFRLFDFSFEANKAYTFWAGLIGGAFFSMATHGADQIMVQRYLCARSLGQARTALVLSGIVVFLQFLLFLLIGIGLYALVQTGGLSLSPGTKNDAVFGQFIVTSLPVGVIGIVVAAVLAAAMSTLSSSLNSSANATVTDFYRPLVPGRSEVHYLRVSRGATAIWGMAQIGVALLAVALDDPRSIIDQVLAVAGFTTGIVLGLFLLGSARRTVSSAAALTGLVAGFAAVLSLWLPSALGKPILAWPWFAPVGALTTVTVALIADRLGIGHGPPPDRGAQPGLEQSR
jgi:SSS family transporter